MYNAKALKAYLIKRIPPKTYYNEFFGEGKIQWVSGGWTDLFCPFHNPQWREQLGKSPSFGIHEEGSFRCQSPSCGVHGNSVVNFHEQYHQIDYKKAMRELYRDWVQPLVSDSRVDDWHKDLMDAPSVLRYIMGSRGLSKNTIERFRLGWDGDRVTIPIEDRFGLVVDVRRYDITGKMPRKIISYKKGYGTARVFPIDNLTAISAGSRVILCEGEWDAMLAIDRGYRAVTITSGAGNWPDDDGESTELFRDKPVRIIYDVNDVNSKGDLTHAGQVGAEKVAAILAPIAKSVKIVKLPIDIQGGDVTDWFMKLGKSKAELDAVIDAAPVYSVHDVPAHGETSKPPGKQYTRLRLDEAADAKHYFKPIEMDCLVSGKDLSPYLAPKQVNITTIDKESGDETTESLEVPIENNKDILRLVDCPQSKLKGTLCEMFGVPYEGTTIETLATFNMEELRIIPAIDLKDMDGTYTIRRALYVGHGLESNRTYRMRGYSLPDPNTQAATHVIMEAEPVQDTVENFELTPEVSERLRQKFIPKDNVRKHMYDIAGWLSRNVTKIKQRPDLHIAVDLVFHSVLGFNFNGEEVTKGWLELLVIGDTRCGKGYVAERMSKHYRLGEVVTGENCSFAGLIGGLQKNDDHFFVTWGKFPLNDKRLLIIDEASAIPLEDMGKFSRVRSEGVAEIIKIVTERTRARTRAIWLANSRSGRPINTYNNGVEAVAELFGNMEDIARLDFALTVATAEVPSRAINAAPIDLGDQDDFTREDFTNLVLWAWSRTPDQIYFTESATALVLETSIRMGREYSPTIPLVQSENIRIKLAKMAAATAARCYSTDETGERLIVKSHHVRFAYEFLTEIYAKPSMGYDVYSSTSISRDTIPNEDAVIDTIRKLKNHSAGFVDGLLNQHHLTPTDIMDLSGLDRFEVQEMVGKLVRLHCIAKEDRYGEVYSKKPGFSKLLRHMQELMKQEGR